MATAQNYSADRLLEVSRSVKIGLSVHMNFQAKKLPVEPACSWGKKMHISRSPGLPSWSVGAEYHCPSSCNRISKVLLQHVPNQKGYLSHSGSQGTKYFHPGPEIPHGIHQICHSLSGHQRTRTCKYPSFKTQWTSLLYFNGPAIWHIFCTLGVHHRCWSQC